MDPGDRCDLTVDERRHLPSSRKTGPFLSMPLGGGTIVIEDWHRRENDLFGIALNGDAAT